MPDKNDEFERDTKSEFERDPDREFEREDGGDAPVTARRDDVPADRVPSDAEQPEKVTDSDMLSRTFAEGFERNPDDEFGRDDDGTGPVRSPQPAPPTPAPDSARQPEKALDSDSLSRTFGDDFERDPDDEFRQSDSAPAPAPTTPDDDDAQPERPRNTVVNWRDAEEHEALDGDDYGGWYRILTPAMDEPGRLGVNMSRMPPGRAGCPFHTHTLEDEVFYIVSGTGVLRYGDWVTRVKPGDCISCPAGTGLGHQLYNDGDADLVYLGIGVNDPNEVCTYPDSGKVMVRSLGAVGQLSEAPYMDGEPRPPRIRALAAQVPRASSEVDGEE